MEHTLSYLLSCLKDLGPWAATAVLLKIMHKFNRATDSLAETRFKADECHKELCEREPQYEHALDAWRAHRKTF